MKRISGPVYVLGDNIDTDQIIPARFLKTISKEGLDKQLFNDWRYDANGNPKPDFILNEPLWQGVQILLAGDNFGCGSSREHAPWALVDYGFRAIVAPSYADIFFNNCYKNGLLPIVLGESEVGKLFDATLAFPGFALTIDLERQVVTTKDGSLAFSFEVEPFRKTCLLDGLDDIGLTLAHADEIRAFEAKRLAEQPWLA
jgi:3-isopropylmalate/(R)-2-methylmalate dehydratase small subunit